MGFPGGSVVKNLPSMHETWVQSLGREDLLEKEMVTHSSILPMDRVHGIFQARILEWVAISSSRRSSRPRD